jgi:hypothetical protein
MMPSEENVPSSLSSGNLPPQILAALFARLTSGELLTCNLCKFCVVTRLSIKQTSCTLLLHNIIYPSPEKEIRNTYTPW